MSLIDDLKSEVAILGHDVEGLAAMAWADIKAGIGVADQAALDAAKKALPQLASILKTEAEAVVKNLMSDPKFLNAAGNWKFGIACAEVQNAVIAVYPVAKSLAVATIESAVQVAFMSLVTGLVA